MQMLVKRPMRPFPSNPEMCAIEAGVFLRAGRLPYAGLFPADLIDIAPLPGLARLEGTNDRVTGRLKMFGRVFVRRAVAAADVSALQALAQVHPMRPDAQTFLASRSARLDLTNVVEVTTSRTHAAGKSQSTTSPVPERTNRSIAYVRAASPERNVCPLAATSPLATKRKPKRCGWKVCRSS